MGTKYTTTTVTGYLGSAPPDDGSTGADNQVKWSQIPTQVGNPLKTALESIDSKLTTFVDLGPDARSTTYTTVAGDHLKTLQCTSTFTVSLMDATSAGAGYTVNIKNYGTGVITVGRITAGDTIDGAAANVTLQPKTGGTFRVITAATGYEVIDSALPDITALAKTDGNIIVGDGTNWVAESGATALTSLGAAATGANTFTATQTIQSTDAGAAEGPILVLDRDSASPAASDLLGVVQYLGEDSAGNDQEYGAVLGKIIDPTAASEDGEVIVRTTIAGTAANRLHVGAGTYTSGATGGDKGADTINASAYYEGGTRMDSQGVAKAWARVEASTGTVSVDDSFNVTSVTDNGAGDYTINFTTAFANANYAFLGLGSGGAGGTGFRHIGQASATAPTTTACRIVTTDAVNSPSHGLADADFSVGFFGDQ